MKKMNIMKKWLVVMAIVAVSALLSIAVIAGTSLDTQNTVDHGEKYEFVQARLSGRVNLKFYYSDLGSADKIVAEVIDPSTNEADNTYVYEKADIEMVTVPASVTGSEDMECYRVTVPVAPSQMTHTVKVYASSAAGDGKAIVYSVKEYCDDVLANEEFASYHNTMRAILNWGAMAQGAFGDAESTLANKDLYALGTNPIDAVTDIPFTEGSVSASESITGKTFSVTLAPDNIIFKFDVNYTGEGTLSATVSREGLEEKAVNVENVGDGVYRVSITNVGVAVFDKPYTIKVTDGTETFTATKSVLEYLSTLSTAPEYADQHDTAKAMYQLYWLQLR